MDDLMSALHWAGQLHGVPSDDCQYKLDGQDYPLLMAQMPIPFK
jgi:hypothetical protein